jgi:heme/copper-type cytochrome/quinol oxidase subunit 1
VIASIGAFVLGASVLPFVWNVFRSYRYGRVVTVAGLRGLATRWSRPPRAELLWENGGRRLRPAPLTAPP